MSESPDVLPRVVRTQDEMFDVINQLLDALIAGRQLSGDVRVHFPDGTLHTVNVRCGTADEVEEVYGELLRCSSRMP